MDHQDLWEGKVEGVQVRDVKEIKDQVLRINLALESTEIGTIVLKGFRVMRSPKYDGIWVQPPSYNIYGKFFPIVFVENQPFWEKLEKLLTEVYESYDFDEESINVDEIIEHLDDETV